MTVSGLGQSMSMLSMLQMNRPSANDIASKIMKKLDTNGDGVLSADEISKAGKHAKKLLAADANGDGQVTMDELVADISQNQQNMQPPSASDVAGKIMKVLDTNGDGVLSTDEISSSGENAKTIQAADANGDGTVTMDELVAYLTKQQQSTQPSSAQDVANSIMNKLDANKDGVLSASDITSGLIKGAASTSGAGKSGSSSTSKIIQAADANGDGKVTMEELLAYISKQYNENQTMIGTEDQSSTLSLVA
jgi:Ca2+-binding EF-hand superfamily protein